MMVILEYCILTGSLNACCPFNLFLMCAVCIIAGKQEFFQSILSVIMIGASKYSPRETRGEDWVSFHHSLTLNYLFAVMVLEVKQESRLDVPDCILVIQDVHKWNRLLPWITLRYIRRVLVLVSFSRRCSLRHCKENGAHYFLAFSCV